MEKADESMGEGKYVDQIPNPEPDTGYRPGRETARTQNKNRKRKGDGSGPRP
jgi:hypothetical protein